MSAAAVLSGRELAWARCVFETVFPGWVEADAERFLVETLAAMPLRGRVGFRVALGAVTVAPCVLERRPVLLPGLQPEERLEVIEAFARSPSYLARSAFTLLKATAALACARTSRRRR